MAPRLAGAVLLGVATLLGPKADPSEHWAVPPRTDVVEVAEDVGQPDPLDELVRRLAGDAAAGNASATGDGRRDDDGGAAGTRDG